MVLKTEICRFSGAKIYPGRGIRFVRSDSQLDWGLCGFPLQMLGLWMDHTHDEIKQGIDEYQAIVSLCRHGHKSMVCFSLREECGGHTAVFLFLNSKCKRYFHNRLKPAKLTWTALYRKQHKKDIHAEAVKKKRRTTSKPYSRSIVGASLEVIQKKRAEKTEVRAAAREAALREIKERIKKTKDEKKAKKAEVMAKASKSGAPKGAPGKAAMPKGPKLGGGGGKR